MWTLRRATVAALLVGLSLGLGHVSAHEKFRFVGRITKVDAPKGEVAVLYSTQGKEDTVIVYLTAQSVVTRDGKKAAKSELKIGLHVVVDALGDDLDDLEVLEIRIVPPPRK